MVTADVFNKYRIVRRYKSKKNQVYLVTPIQGSEVLKEGELVILKRYLSSIQGEVGIVKEIYWLNYLKSRGLNVPEILSQGQDYLILSYLPGETLCDYFYRMERAGVDVRELASILDKFYGWLKGFYRLARMERDWILGDVNLRNFILHDNGEIYGIDLEDCLEGKIEEDVGKICAFALTYNPACTGWKVRLVRELFAGLVKGLALDCVLVQKEFENGLRAIEKRRGPVIPEGLNLSALSFGNSFKSSW